MREAGASLFGAIAVSTILTAVIAFPLAVRAVDASAGLAGVDESIALDDNRFPDPVPLGGDQTEMLARAATDEIDAEVAGATVSATTPATPEASTTETTAPAEDELALAIPTPTSEPDRTDLEPTPAPAAPPATTAPTEVPAIEADATPPPTPPPPPTTEATAPPTPEADTELRDSPVDEPAEALDQSSTDVYAFVSGAPLRENRVSTLELNTVNRGSEMTTGVSVAVTASGGSILSMAPASPGWTCSGTDTTWRCNGPTLQAQSSSRSLMTILPEDEAVSLSISVSHELPDTEPDNNTFQMELPVEPDSVDPTDPADPVDPPVDPVAPPVDPADPTDPPQPADPIDPTDPTDPADPADPGGGAGGTAGPGEPLDPGERARGVDQPGDGVDSESRSDTAAGAAPTPD